MRDTPTNGRPTARLTADVSFGDGRMVLIAGPCVIENRDLTFEIAGELQAICERLSLPLVFKGSVDKANRTAGSSFRSIGLDKSLSILADVKAELGLPVTTDVHETWQVAPVAEVVDVLQIPAFLCRQTDLLVAAGGSGRAVNIKKGQFLAAADMGYAVEKVRQGGGTEVVVTERGTTFGYHDLVVDFRNLAIMRPFAPVIFDATHSVQSPGGAGGATGGKREYVAPLARAACAFGIDGLFLETHPDPDRSPSDGPNMVPLHELEGVLQECLALRAARSAR